MMLWARTDRGPRLDHVRGAGPPLDNAMGGAEGVAALGLSRSNGVPAVAFRCFQRASVRAPAAGNALSICTATPLATEAGLSPFVVSPAARTVSYAPHPDL